MARHIKEIQGLKFGRLTVLRKLPERRYKKVMWECICECGKIVVAATGHLTSGHTKSCGCYVKDRNIEIHTTHGETHTRLYSIWLSMKNRCNNPKNKAYFYYGGKGVSVCEEWENSFESFRDWAKGNGYKSDLTLDRINPDGNYEPSNCRWATWHEQRMNQRRD